LALCFLLRRPNATMIDLTTKSGGGEAEGVEDALRYALCAFKDC